MSGYRPGDLGGVVFALHGRCRDCGSPLPGARAPCTQCIEGWAAQADRERMIFEGLLKLGISRETANIMLISKHEHERTR